MKLLLKEWKLTLAALFLLTSAGFALAVKVQGVRLDRAKLTIAQRDATVKELQQAVVDRDVALAQLTAVSNEQNIAIKRWQAEGAMLEDALRRTEARLTEERHRWVEAEAEMSKPLPDRCEEKVREAVRRIQAAVRGMEP